MRFVVGVLRGGLVAFAIALAIAAAWLAFAPPDLLRLGSAYAAKIVCSNVFLAERDPDAVMALDVQAPGNPLLKLMSADVDEEARTVTAGLFGIFARQVAVARQESGCVSVPDGDLQAADATDADGAAAHLPADALWPEGARVEPVEDAALDAILDDAALAGPGMRAIVVVHDGRIVGERYAEGFAPQTPLLGWSMTKTVNAAILGLVVERGELSLDTTGLFDSWKADERAGISVADLLAMQSGLAFNEDYGSVTDVTRMLYLEPDMAAFAASKPLINPVGKVFSYSTGTSVLLARIWQNAAGEDAASLPRAGLFGPLGMESAVFEMDEKGTFVGGSYLYATARDWARFGQFMLQDGAWGGKALLSPDYIAMMRTPTPASNGAYGKGQLWVETQATSAATGVPVDAYRLDGHDGQSVTIVPSKKLVVVRMGLTPADLGYKPAVLVSALSKWAQ